MGLAADIRSAIAQGKLAIADLLSTVTLEVCTGSDGDTKKTYATGVQYQAFVWTYEGIAARTKVSRIIGQEDVAGPKIIFLQSLLVTTKDRITLADGSRPPIVSVLDIPDPAGGTYFTEVRCGRPERGVIS